MRRKGDLGDGWRAGRVYGLRSGQIQANPTFEPVGGVGWMAEAIIDQTGRGYREGALL
jgi:hypothetical protein